MKIGTSLIKKTINTELTQLKKKSNVYFNQNSFDEYFLK